MQDSHRKSNSNNSYKLSSRRKHKNEPNEDLAEIERKSDHRPRQVIHYINESFSLENSHKDETCDSPLPAIRPRQIVQEFQSKPIAINKESDKSMNDYYDGTKIIANENQIRNSALEAKFRSSHSNLVFNNGENPMQTNNNFSTCMISSHR